MLQINQSITDKITHSIATGSHELAIANQSALSESDYHSLGKLAHKKQWILYTADCPRPDYDRLTQQNIHNRSVIHMKPSAQFSEKEIIIKAIDAGTACAVVASGDFTVTERSNLTAYASRKGCCLLFVSKSSDKGYACH